ncbi:hypothetical protein JOB18_040652 [Solea senegalensis]|uniref:Uncharacterized protein n=1 Tax=Solea senegalensis TaxID=28829 RepID=A0AAV6QQ11_SOLSE|nr:hypothetical protein JOB18_040652 [Solea senegalensis]
MDVMEHHLSNIWEETAELIPLLGADEIEPLLTPFIVMMTIKKKKQIFWLTRQ